MDILVPDSWLREYLITNATPQKIAECLSLCGPSVEKINLDGDTGQKVYLIEVTSNRADAASVYGIAQEAAAILPQFGIRAKLKPLKVKSNQPFVKKVTYLNAKVDNNLCPRFAAILIRNVKYQPSPFWISQRLKQVGSRPINNIVDISNYLMFELGQPLHIFDYDKISNQTMILRSSRKGERITTLDGKEHILPGGDIVIEDGKGRLIDLAGIMGGKLSEVDENTKNILVFVQTYNSQRIRQTTMKLGFRTQAATLFEKGLDPEKVATTIRYAVDFFVKVCHGQPENTILDIYPNPYRAKTVVVEHKFIERILGIKIAKSKISKILRSLGFEVVWKHDKLFATPPSWRSQDIAIPEDIVEEIARLYGYHNLPSQLINGRLPENSFDDSNIFEFERKIKEALKGFGGTEVYTFSLVDKESVSNNALKIKNPLGPESAFLRTSLKPSLIKAIKENKGIKEPIHLFEVSNVYIPRKNDLPEEKMMVAGIFSNYTFRKAKGVVENLLEELRIDTKYAHLELFEDYYYYEFAVSWLQKMAGKQIFKPIPKYPAQVEDITFVLPKMVFMEDIICEIKSADSQVVSVKFLNEYQGSATFRLFYQNPHKTLTDKEVEAIRKKVKARLAKKFGITF